MEGENGEREIERGREGVTENGVFRGLVFWILTSQLCVCVCVCYILIKCNNDCVLMGDWCTCVRAFVCVCLCDLYVLCMFVCLCARARVCVGRGFWC